MKLSRKDRPTCLSQQYYPVIPCLRQRNGIDNRCCKLFPSLFHLGKESLATWGQLLCGRGSKPPGVILSRQRRQESPRSGRPSPTTMDDWLDLRSVRLRLRTCVRGGAKKSITLKGEIGTGSVYCSCFYGLPSLNENHVAEPHSSVFMAESRGTD